MYLMNSTQFAKKLSEYKDKQEKDTFADVSKINLKEVENVLTFDFGMPSLRTVVPLFGKKVLISDDMADLVQTAHFQKVIIFSVFGVVTRTNFYLLVSAPIEFFSNKTENSPNNPFEEDEDFDKFATQLSKFLGMTNVELYESDDGYYYATVEIDSKCYSFFLYKV